MHAERMFLETDEFGNLKAVPPLPPKSRVEAIFLVLPEASEKGPRASFEETFTPATDFSRRLWALYHRAKSAGLPQLDDEAFDREIADRKGRKEVD